METLLYVIHVTVCLAMLPIILLQSGKGGGVSQAFGGGGSQTVFGSRGASTFLTRMTSGAAIIFMCTSLGLAGYSSKSKSVVGDVPPLEQPQDEARTDPGAPPTPANTAAPPIEEEGALDPSGAPPAAPAEVPAAPPAPNP